MCQSTRLTDSYVGEAPDIGAYEYGGIYWKPGYQPMPALFYRKFIEDPAAIH